MKCVFYFKIDDNLKKPTKVLLKYEGGEDEVIEIWSEDFKKFLDPNTALYLLSKGDKAIIKTKRGDVIKNVPVEVIID